MDVEKVVGVEVEVVAGHEILAEVIILDDELPRSPRVGAAIRKKPLDRTRLM